VVVEVIVREVGEHRDVERHTVDPLLLQSMRRDLHRHFHATSLKRTREKLIQLQCFRSCVLCRQNLIPNAILHCAHQRGLAATGAQHGVQQERGRGLAVGSRNAGNGQPFRRTAVEIRAEPRQRAASMYNLGPRYVRPERQRITHHSHSSSLQRGIDVVVAVGVFAAHGNEAPSWLHSSAVVIQSGDVRIALLRQVFSAIQQLEEIHSRGIIAVDVAD
jgi:hypothetical protein